MGLQASGLRLLNGIIKLKKIILIAIALFGLITIVVDQRTNLLIYSMTTEGLPDLLEPKDEGDEVRWFDDYYTIQKIDERTFAIGEPRYYQLNFNYLIIVKSDTRAVIFDAGTGQRDIRRVVESLTRRKFQLHLFLHIYIMTILEMKVDHL